MRRKLHKQKLNNLRLKKNLRKPTKMKKQTKLKLKWSTD